MLMLVYQSRPERTAFCEWLERNGIAYTDDGLFLSFGEISVPAALTELRDVIRCHASDITGAASR